MKIPFSRKRISEAFKILSFFLILPVFLLGTIAPALNADVVIYVSGKTEKNVKTKLQRNTLFIRYENGSSKEVSKKLVKTVKFLPAIWSVQVPENLSEKKRQEYLQKLEAEEEKRLEEETGDGNEWIPRPETDFVSPTLIAGKSIFPFYSGFLLSESPYLGYGMIGIKTLSLALAVRENNAAYLAFYLSLVPLDAYFGYVSAEKWNSGTFTGDKFPEKETHPLSRLWRSALIPGWGQFYSGEPLKGGLFLASFLILDTTLGSVSDKLNGVRYEKQVYNQIAPISAFVSGSDNTPSIYLSYRNLELTSLEKRYQTERGQILTLAGIFYLYNLLDAYFNSGTNPTEPEESLSFRPFLFKNEDKFLSTRETVFGGSLEWIY